MVTGDPLLEVRHVAKAFGRKSVLKDISFSLSASQRQQALIFISLAAVGILTSFLALSLTQKHAPENRRLILCGFRTSELLLSKFAVLLTVTACVGTYA